MKKLLLSLTMLSIIACSAKANNNGDDQIKKSIEKYAKDSLAKKFNQYKGITTIVTDTIKIREFFKSDSAIIEALKERESSPFTMLTQREMINQEMQLRKRIAPNTIDYKAIKLYQKPDLKVSTLSKASKENLKKNNPNKEVYGLLHTFEYTDKKGFTVTDSAMFIHSPESIRMVASAIKYDKGVNFTGTIKTIRSYMLELMSKMPRPQMPPNQQEQPNINQQPANKE